MIWLHWALMFIGGLVAYGAIAYPFCCWLGRHLHSTTDPDYCRDKALEFAGDAYRQREG